jgi:hypothetical protein
MSKTTVFSTVLKKFGDKLIYANGAHETLYKSFVNSLENDHRVQVFFDASQDTGTLAQIAKIKVCIRELAKETGNTFEDTELEIKKASGLCIVKVIDGEKYLFCKSFGDCSKEDLSLAIQTIIQRGSFLNMNFN